MNKPAVFAAGFATAILTAAIAYKANRQVIIRRVVYEARAAAAPYLGRAVAGNNALVEPLFTELAAALERNLP